MGTVLDDMPSAARLWDEDRNHCPASAVAAKSNKKWWWTCPDGHHYQLSCDKMHDDDQYCPYDHGRVLKGYNDLASTRPDVMAWWSWDENQREGLDPYALLASSNKRAWWRDPHHRHHVWRSSIQNRANTRNGGCSVCLGLVIIPGVNDVASDDHLLRLWHDNRDPTTISRSSLTSCTWTCPYGDVFTSSPRALTHDHDACPICQDLVRYGHMTDYPEVMDRLDRSRLDQPIERMACRRSASYDWLCSEGHPVHATIGRIMDRGVDACCQVCAHRRIDTIADHHDAMLAWWPGNPGDPTMIRSSDDRYWLWSCNTCGEIFSASARAMCHLRKSQCPFCDGRLVIPGVNDSSGMHPDWPSICDDELWGSVKNPDIGHWSCRHDHHWLASMATMKKWHGRCPFEDGRLWLDDHSNSLAKTRPNLASAWSDENGCSADDVLACPSDRRQYVWSCPVCGGHYHRSLKAMIRTGLASCPYCRRRQVLPGWNDLATERPDLMVRWSDKNTVDPTAIGVWSKTPVYWTCDHGHDWTWMSPPSVEARGGYASGCDLCKHKTLMSGVNDLATERPDLADEWDDQANGDRRPDQVMINDRTQIVWTCQHGRHWTCSVTGRAFEHDGHCPKCVSGRHTSSSECDLGDTIQSMLGDDHLVLRNDRSVLGGSEIDVLVPDLHLGFEYNGLHWHACHRPEDVSRHEDKTRLAADHGIRLMTIWEDDWLDHRTIVEDHLTTLLRPDLLRPLNARSYVVVIPDRDTARSFLRVNHIQGAPTGCVFMALARKEDHDDLAAVIAYRVHDGEMRLVRYAALLGCRLRGGLSRLLHHAIVAGDIDHVITFSDNSVSDGSMYRRLGFYQDAVLPADYAYIIGKQRQHKFTYRKRRFRDDPDLIFVEGLTEQALAELNGLERIYDCGKIRWRFDVHRASHESN